MFYSTCVIISPLLLCFYLIINRSRCENYNNTNESYYIFITNSKYISSCMQLDILKNKYKYVKLHIHCKLFSSINNQKFEYEIRI